MGYGTLFENGRGYGTMSGCRALSTHEAGVEISPVITTEPSYLSRRRVALRGAA